MKFFRISILAFLILLPVFSRAEVYINEIMYDLSGSDTDREWVEIYNSGPDTATITVGSGSGSWRFVDSSAHVLNIVSGQATISSGQYFLIAKNSTQFLSDWPSFQGTLFTSSISLSNTSATLSIKDGSGAVLDQASYSSDIGANGDGNSLQKSNTTWSASLPTPGFVNSNNLIVATTTTSQTATTTSSSNTDASSNTQPVVIIYSAHSSPASLSDIENKIEFEISAGRDRLTSIGNSLVFKVIPTKLQNISEQSIIYQWSFGDGTVGQGSLVNHTYRFPGEYSVIVNASAGDKQAVSRLTVRVVSPVFSLVRVPEGIEISNKSGVEINLEGWGLASKEKTFIFPKDTLIPADKKVTFADEVTGVSTDSIELINPMQKSFATLSSEVPLTLVSTSSPNLENIQAKINEVKTTLAKISVPPQNNIPAVALTKSVALIIPTESVSAEASSTQSANTATVFEATKQTGLVSTIFSWPIKGFNFIRHLFVEG